MVLLTSILIIIVLYYLQGGGLIYVTIIAVVAELINLFMSQTMAKTVKVKEARLYNKIINTQKAKIAQQSKTITEFKKIRDDSGFWGNVEQYISKHSNVDFSHGICPECLKIEYPEVYIKLNGRGKI